MPRITHNLKRVPKTRSTVKNPSMTTLWYQ